jgi:hypothetical protein
MFNPFSSKPVQPVQRTTDPDILKQKAIDFLDKNYSRIKNRYESILPTIYMLESKSINGIKRVEPKFNTTRIINKTDHNDKYEEKVWDARVTYTDTLGNKYDKTETITPFPRYKDIKPDNNVLWTRLFGTGVGKSSASDVVLGGRRRKSRRKSRRIHKTRRH